MERYKGKPDRVQSALARRMRQGCTSPPPPLLQSCIGLLRDIVFVILRNFHEIFNLVFREIFLEFRENQNYFAKISCFAKFWQNNSVIYNSVDVSHIYKIMQYSWNQPA